MQAYDSTAAIFDQPEPVSRVNLLDRFDTESHQKH